MRNEAGFTLLEVLLAALMLGIVAAPISAVLVAASATAGVARERTAAGQLAQTTLETMRTLSYTQVGIVNGNPPGVMAASTSTKLPSGEAVTVHTAVAYVADPIPLNPYPTNADYKKVVLTVTRNSDGKQLAQATTYVASASAPPLSGSDWVQVKRTAVDAVTVLPVVGASVNLTGGPGSENRTDTTDAAGIVLFPALDSSTAIPPPNYTLGTTYPGNAYLVFPDDIAPGAPSLIPASPGASSTNTIRMYKTGVSLTVNVQTSTGAPYTGGATIWLDSSRCGQAATVPNGQSSVTITSCVYTGNTSVMLPPNLPGQTPVVFDKYNVTANSGTSWSPAVAVAVPSAYPTTLTQSATVKFSGTTYSTTKAIKVTVTKAGSNDTKARVELTGTPTGLASALYLYGTTDGSGTVTFNVPVVAGATVYTVNANDMGTVKGTGSASVSTVSGATTNVTVAVS